MLLNCLNCGKSVSNRKEFCPYCRHEIPVYLQETRQQRSLTRSLIKTNCKGTIMSVVKR
ncbi:TPA: hypothetical protein DCW56_03355 [Candidatus Peregrinibacteria bacterium]|nr:hypothetical protein [Candidatus Peregrinibacteria bacterium]